MIRVWIENLTMYNNGVSIGRWLNLPATDEQIDETINEICKPGDEYFIPDYQTDIKHLEISEYEMITELNEFAGEIESFGEEEKMALSAFLYHGYNYQDAVRKVNDGDYIIYSDCYDMTDVAYQVVDETDMLHGVPDTLTMYFDYQAYGRDISINGSFYYAGNGCYVEII